MLPFTLSHLDTLEPDVLFSLVLWEEKGQI